MKMNWMRMAYYWICNFIFDNGFYALAIFVFLHLKIGILDLGVCKYKRPIFAIRGI